ASFNVAPTSPVYTSAPTSDTSKSGSTPDDSGASDSLMPLVVLNGLLRLHLPLDPGATGPLGQPLRPASLHITFRARRDTFATNATGSGSDRSGAASGTPPNADNGGGPDLDGNVFYSTSQTLWERRETASMRRRTRVGVGPAGELSADYVDSRDVQDNNNLFDDAAAAGRP
ncbi:hypothetical protein HK405_006753, partial [Cladochytrium tenue]